MFLLLPILVDIWKMSHTEFILYPEYGSDLISRFLPKSATRFPVLILLIMTSGGKSSDWRKWSDSTQAGIHIRISCLVKKNQAASIENLETSGKIPCWQGLRRGRCGIDSSGNLSEPLPRPEGIHVRSTSGIRTRTNFFRVPCAKVQPLKNEFR